MDTDVGGTELLLADPAAVASYAEQMGEDGASEGSDDSYDGPDDPPYRPPAAGGANPMEVVRARREAERAERNRLLAEIERFRAQPGFDGAVPEGLNVDTPIDRLRDILEQCQNRSQLRMQASSRRMAVKFMGKIPFVTATLLEGVNRNLPADSQFALYGLSASMETAVTAGEFDEIHGMLYDKYLRPRLKDGTIDPIFLWGMTFMAVCTDHIDGCNDAYDRGERDDPRREAKRLEEREADGSGSSGSEGSESDGGRDRSRAPRPDAQAQAARSRIAAARPGRDPPLRVAAGAAPTAPARLANPPPPYRPPIADPMEWTESGSEGPAGAGGESDEETAETEGSEGSEGIEGSEGSSDGGGAGSGSDVFHF